MGKFKIFILFLILCQATLAQKKFQINGAARAYYFANSLDIDPAIDTVTSKQSNYGHTLADVGISVFPNQQTEIISMFRVRNEFGGFWGAAVNFQVRQLTLKGVAAKRVRYELGDIDLKASPYTLWNFTEEDHVNESDLFKARREVVHYDLFYNQENKWRMQGAKINFSFNAIPIVNKIGFNAFITRQRAAMETVPERLYGGGTVDLIKNERLNAKIHSVNLFDLSGTVNDSASFQNGVHTALLSYKLSSIATVFSLEAGGAQNTFRNYGVGDSNLTISDWILDAKASLTLPAKIKLSLGYKDIGPDFYSAGAQTRRIDFSQFPTMFQQITNQAVGRSINLQDFISANTANTKQISPALLGYHPALSNVHPFGQATPNRRGIYLNGSRNDSSFFRSVFVKTAFLQQSRGTGSLEKKNFLLIEGGSDVYFSDWLKWKRKLKLDAGVRWELTNRAGETYEAINLSSLLIDVGLGIGLTEKFDLLLGGKSWSAKGNAFINERNEFNQIIDFTALDIRFTQLLVAGGIHYDFGKKNGLTAQYQYIDFEDKSKNLTYGLSQFTLLFNLNF